jgi:hypothetical protein
VRLARAGPSRTLKLPKSKRAAQVTKQSVSTTPAPARFGFGVRYAAARWNCEGHPRPSNLPPPTPPNAPESRSAGRTAHPTRPTSCSPTAVCAVVLGVTAGRAPRASGPRAKCNQGLISTAIAVYSPSRPRLLAAHSMTVPLSWPFLRSVRHLRCTVNPFRSLHSCGTGHGPTLVAY